MCYSLFRRGTVAGVLLLICSAFPVTSSFGQTKRPGQHSTSVLGLSKEYVRELQPDTTSDWWQEHHISISSRHYIGVEFGTTHSWLNGARGFYFPISGSQRTIPFASLGSGEGYQFGGEYDYSLSDHFGLAGKLLYFNTITQETEGTTGAFLGSDGIYRSEPATASYTSSHTFLGADALVRYQIVPQQYYALAGGGVSVPISESLTSTMTANGAIGATLPAFRINSLPSDSYYNSIRGDLKFGFGTFIPITEDMVVTPEIMLSVPVTTLLSRQYENYYSTNGARAPRLWYISASVAVKFQNGGFSLYATERERERQYLEQYRRSAILHPMPLVHHQTRLQMPAEVATVRIKKLRPDYEVDAQNRLIAWDDVGEDKPTKLRLIVFFETAKADIMPYSFEDLNHLARVMIKHPQLGVEIAAFTDSRGSAEKNLDLSERRAKAVQQYVAAHGVDTTRLPAKGFGAQFPVASNETAEGRASNRRVEFIVIHDEASAEATPAEMRAGN